MSTASHPSSVYGLTNTTTITSHPFTHKGIQDLLPESKDLQIPPGAKLFTVDATAMYTNIDTEIVLQTFRALFNKYEADIPSTFPKEFFLSVLELVMNNNIFKFGDTFCQKPHYILS